MVLVLVLVARRWGPLRHLRLRDAGPVREAALVEARGGESADFGVHAVLHREAVHEVAALLEALEEGPLEPELRRRRGPHRRRQLPRVAHEDEPLGSKL